MRKLYWLLLIVAVGMFLFAGGNLVTYYRQTDAADDVNQNMIQSAVQTTKEPEMSLPAGEAGGHEIITAPIRVDFDTLQAQYPDIVAWLYSEGTPINYPVVQSRDNAYYLRRLPDGSANRNGSLFLDYRNSGDFSDLHSIIYGHNMKNEYMLGTLERYQEQAYYEAHPVMYLLTPTGDYQVRLLGGYTTTTQSPGYQFVNDPQGVADLTLLTRQRSDFVSEAVPEPGEGLLTLSTCDYETEESRFIVVGVLHPIG